MKTIDSNRSTDSRLSVNPIDRSVRWFVKRRCLQVKEMGASGEEIYQAACEFQEVKNESPLQPVRELRDQLALNRSWIETVDFGSGKRKIPGAWVSFEKPVRRQVSEIYRRSAIPDSWGSFLFHLARKVKPRHILELGTNLGISASYLANAVEDSNEQATITTIEGDPILADLARKHLSRTNVLVEVVNGSFQEQLPKVLNDRGPFSLVFIDGHHDEAATIRYVHTIKPFLDTGAVVILDDTEPWARNVRRAWKHLRTEPEVEASVDLLKMGILIFR